MYVLLARVGVGAEAAHSGCEASCTMRSSMSYTAFDSVRKRRYPSLVGCHCTDRHSTASQLCRPASNILSLLNKRHNSMTYTPETNTECRQSRQGWQLRSMLAFCQGFSTGFCPSFGAWSLVCNRIATKRISSTKPARNGAEQQRSNNAEGPRLNSRNALHKYREHDE